MANYETKISFGVDLKGAQSAQKALDDLNKKAIDNAKKQRDQATLTADDLAKVAEEARKAAEAVANNGKREDAEQKKRIKNARELAKEKQRASADAGRVQEAAIKKVQRLEEHDHVQKLRRAAAQEKESARLGEREHRRKIRQSAIEDREMERTQQKAAAAEQRMQAAQAVTASRRGAFTQGLLQGAMPGNITRMIDRGPGAFRQAAGIMTGQSLASLASIPFTGVGGIMNAAGAFGSFVSAPLERMFGNEGGALSRQRGQMGLRPFLGAYGTQSMAGTGGIAGLSDQALHFRAVQEAMHDGNARLTNLGNPQMRAKGGGDITAFRKYVVGQRSPEQRIAVAEGRLRAERERDREAGPSYNPLAALGRQYGGLDVAQTQQFVASQAMRAGGQGADLARQGLVDTGLAANVKYGIGADVSGAFGRAGRIGGIVGGAGEGSDKGFAKVIGNAVALGLTGSDLTRATEKMADILGNFETSGIPLAAGAIGSAAAGFAKMGLSAPMAQAAGTGMTQSLQQLGDQGPQDALGIALMQAVGGGTSYRSQLNAMEELRNPTAGTLNKAFKGIAPRFINRGQGPEGREQIRQFMKRMQMPHDKASVAAISAAVGRGDTSLPRELTDALTPDALKQSAQGLTPGALQNQAAASDRKANLGETAVGAGQAADATADALAHSFSIAVSPVLGRLTDALNNVVSFLSQDAANRQAMSAAADGAARVK